MKTKAISKLLYATNYSVENTNFDNLIYELNIGGESEKVYYGSNFSAFYISWKTGKIGLIALEGRGLYQGKIDEKLLVSKGFTKKTN